MEEAKPQNVRGLYRAEYERMVELGLFQDVRVELLDGQLVEMSPQGEAHASVVAHLADLLRDALPATMQIRQHSGLRAGQKSMPEPDLVVIERRSGHHHPDQAFLVVEVSDSSLRNDREIKAEIYASLGVPEYWVVDLVHQQVVVHTRPSVRGYRQVVIHDRDATLRPIALPTHALRVGDVLDC